MSNVEFDKIKKSESGLFSFNNFLSTSIELQRRLNMLSALSTLVVTHYLRIIPMCSSLSNN